MIPLSRFGNIPYTGPDHHGSDAVQVNWQTQSQRQLTSGQIDAHSQGQQADMIYTDLLFHVILILLSGSLSYLSYILHIVSSRSSSARSFFSSLPKNL